MVPFAILANLECGAEAVAGFQKLTVRVIDAGGGNGCDICLVAEGLCDIAAEEPCAFARRESRQGGATANVDFCPTTGANGPLHVAPVEAGLEGASAPDHLQFVRGEDVIVDAVGVGYGENLGHFGTRKKNLTSICEKKGRRGPAKDFFTASKVALERSLSRWHHLGRNFAYTGRAPGAFFAFHCRAALGSVGARPGECRVRGGGRRYGRAVRAAGGAGDSAAARTGSGGPVPALSAAEDRGREETGRRATRTLLVPAVGDRILQTAVARHLSRSFEEEFSTSGMRFSRTVAG